MKRNAKAMQNKAKKNQVQDNGAGRGYTVTSATSSKGYHVATVGRGFQCTCRWAKYHNTVLEPCSHVLAIEEYLAQSEKRALSFWATKEAAQRQHRPTEYTGRGLLQTSRKAGS